MVTADINKHLKEKQEMTDVLKVKDTDDIVIMEHMFIRFIQNIKRHYFYGFLNIF